MAFLDFTQPMAGPAPLAAVTATPAPADPAPAIATGFTAQEWQIVALARTDGLRSLNGPGRFVRLRRWIFGEETNLTLASERLEALRRSCRLVMVVTAENVGVQAWSVSQKRWCPGAGSPIPR